MAKVTVFEGGAVQRQGTTTARFQPQDFGDNALAGGLKSIGGALQDFAEVEADISRRRAEARVKQADVEAETTLATLRGNELSTEKFGAMGAVERYQKEADKVRAQVSKGLKSPREREAFDLVFKRRLASDLPTLQLHERRQVVGAEREASVARITTYVDRGVELREDPIASQEALATAISESDKLYASDGPDVARQKRNAIVSGYRVQVADAIAANRKNPRAAKDAEAYIGAHADQILETDETIVRRRLAPHVEEAEIDDAVLQIDAIVAGKDGPPDEYYPAAPGEPEPKGEAQYPGWTFDKAKGRLVSEPPERVRSASATANADPLRGKGRVTATPAQHLKRGRLALDLAAPVGTPIYPPMSGKVVEKGFKAAGNGHYVKVRHPNGLTTTYLHMRGASPLDEGEEVTANTVLGGVGSTGKSTGPHLDYSVKDKSGTPINPQTVKWAEGDLPQFQAQRNDKQSLYDVARRVATERNYSVRQYEQLLQRVDARVAREDGLRERVEQEAIRVAADTVAAIEEGGGILTRRDQVPNWNALPGTARIQLLGQIRQNTQPKPIDANGDTVLTFELMAVNEPAKFAGADLRYYRHQMTAGEFGALAKTQAEIRQKGVAAPVVTNHGRIWGMIDRYGPDVGLAPKSENEKDRQRSHRVFETVRDDLNRLTEGKRQPTDDEVKSAFDRATMEVVVRGGGFLGLRDSRARRFEVDPGDKAAVQMPRDVHDRIAASFRRTTGRAPTEQEIGQTYMAHKGKPGFWP